MVSGVAFAEPKCLRSGGVCGVPGRGKRCSCVRIGVGSSVELSEAGTVCVDSKGAGGLDRRRACSCFGSRC